MHSGRCPECKRPLLKTSPEFALCEHCNVKLIPGVPKSAINRAMREDAMIAWTTTLIKAEKRSGKWYVGDKRARPLCGERQTRRLTGLDPKSGVAAMTRPGRWRFFQTEETENADQNQ